MNNEVFMPMRGCIVSYFDPVKRLFRQPCLKSPPPSALTSLHVGFNDAQTLSVLYLYNTEDRLQ